MFAGAGPAATTVHAPAPWERLHGRGARSFRIARILGLHDEVLHAGIDQFRAVRDDLIGRAEDPGVLLFLGQAVGKVFLTLGMDFLSLSAMKNHEVKWVRRISS